MRPADSSVLAGRPLVDLGTGDGRTLAGLEGLAVGIDRSMDALRAARNAGVRRLVCAAAAFIPLRDGAAAVVVAGDLFHHMDDQALGEVLGEVARILRPGGKLVAWWYEHPGRGGPDSPAHPRSFDGVARLAVAAGLPAVEPLSLAFGLEPAPATVGLLASRS